jgi:hypothetical protein
MFMTGAGSTKMALLFRFAVVMGFSLVAQTMQSLAASVAASRRINAAGYKCL